MKKMQRFNDFVVEAKKDKAKKKAVAKQDAGEQPFEASPSKQLSEKEMPEGWSESDRSEIIKLLRELQSKIKEQSEDDAALLGKIKKGLLGIRELFPGKKLLKAA